MDLVATLAAPPVKNTPGRSVMDDWVDGLPEGEREAVMAAVVNPAWGHVALRDVLVDAGAPFLADTSIRMWRTKLGWRRES